MIGIPLIWKTTQPEISFSYLEDLWKAKHNWFLFVISIDGLKQISMYMTIDFITELMKTEKRIKREKLTKNLCKISNSQYISSNCTFRLLLCVVVKRSRELCRMLHLSCPSFNAFFHELQLFNEYSRRRIETKADIDESNQKT